VTKKSDDILANIEAFNEANGGGVVKENGISLCDDGCHLLVKVYHQTGTPHPGYSPTDLYAKLVCPSTKRTGPACYWGSRPAFVEVVPRLLDADIPVVITVAQKGQGLIAQVKASTDVHLVTATEANRDGLPEELERWVRDTLRSR